MNTAFRLITLSMVIAGGTLVAIESVNYRSQQALSNAVACFLVDVTAFVATWLNTRDPEPLP